MSAPRGLVVLALAACSRTSGGGDAAPPPLADAAATASAHAARPAGADGAAPATPLPSAAPAALAPAEAARAHVARFADAPALAALHGALEAHFAGAPRAAGFDVQTVELSLGGWRANVIALARAPISDARPLLAITDEHGRLAWSKEHPIAGIFPPVSAIALAAGPRGRIALAACNPPTRAVALRLWDGDGSPFADFQVLEMESCEDVSLLYWPGRGWIVVAAGVGVTRARLVTESGSLRWGAGLDLGLRSRAGSIAAASLAPDTDETFVLAQIAPPEGDGERRALAFRYDLAGAPIWSRASDLGALARAPAPGERIALTRSYPAGVRASIAGALDVEIKPSGAIGKPR